MSFVNRVARCPVKIGLSSTWLFARWKTKVLLDMHVSSISIFLVFLIFLQQWYFR